jgi:hypothetical protein
MKKIYWRPREVSRPALILISLISIAGLMVVEAWKVRHQQPFFEEKLAAANLAKKAMERIKQVRLERGAPIDTGTDPSESGLIGLPMSLVTTVTGEVSAKQTSVNPNFAAVVVDMLKEVDVGRGDVVAVGCSGSFPALNICTFAALETLGVKPLVISSASASQWGANIPQLLWPDMELELRKPWVKPTEEPAAAGETAGEASESETPPAEGETPPADAAATAAAGAEGGAAPVEEPAVFNIRSIAFSRGGYDDQGLGLTPEGVKLVEGAIQRNGKVPFDVPDFVANIDARMKLYKDHAQGQPIKAYINVGGGTVSVGKNIGKQMFKPGVNFRPPRHVREVDGVMPRFSREGVPVIHLVHINALAARYGMPLEPQTAVPVPDGGVFVGIDYSKPLVAGVLAFILLSLYGFIRSDVGFRIFRTARGGKRSDAPPEPMV